MASEKQIKFLPWPSLNPDLNPIEKLWHEINIKVIHRAPTNIQELKRVVVDEQKKIPAKA